MDNKTRKIKDSLTTREARGKFWDSRRQTKKMRESIIRNLILQGMRDEEIALLVGVSKRTIQRRRSRK